MKLSIIVPCYNEAEGIPQLRERLPNVVKSLEKSYGVELIFVDDGSTDNTAELLHKNFAGGNVKIMRHERNMNLGAALRTGFLAATGDVIVTMDSDCTYAPENIPELLKELSDCDIVTASPYHPLGKVVGAPAYRLFLSKSVTKLYSIVTGRHLYTWTALFRAYRRSAISDITITHDNFIAVVEILIKSIKNRKKIKELPETLYGRRFGTSKMKIISTIVAHLKFLMESVGIIHFSGAK